MDSNLKRKKLKDLANSVFDDSNHKEEITYFMKKLNLDKDKIIKSYIDYDTGMLEYDNNIYESLSLRAALYLHYLLKNSWHQKRQQVILDILNKSQSKRLVDVGFGAPTKYIREYVLKNKDVTLTLLDLYNAAFEFAETIFEFLDSSYKKSIDFKKYDMNSFEYIGDYDTYIFQDSIEHINNPTKYLKMIIKKSPKNSKFILSLPICPLIPSHYIAWENNDEAISWLKECGLKIEFAKEVHVNPKVDLFAEDLNDPYNYIILCSKL